ncbi:hypothetical protein [Actinoallomurus sp. NPDC052274]|uniref:hypothetical protein n=1 Tax=Actinoallomurus sp. NPDC052274 TaxID=3155420 RepID=UPI0034220955
MDDRKPPPPPKGAGRAGRKLWNSIVKDLDLDLDTHEELLLVQAVRCADRLDSMAAELENAPLTLRNARGDEVAHPLLVESRQQSILLSRLLASLRLPSGLQDDDMDRPQRRGASRRPYGFRVVS